MIPKRLSYFFRSIPGTGGEAGLVVLQPSSVSHVFDKFKDILFLAAQFSRFLTSASAVSEFLLTGTMEILWELVICLQASMEEELTVV